MTSSVLETSRLIIRAFQADDLYPIHRILELTMGDGSKIADEEALNERRSWLEWSRLSAEWLPRMFQPPYGDRAVVLKRTNAVIGAVGYVPCIEKNPFPDPPWLQVVGILQNRSYKLPA